jgi:hypothetical protein
MGQQGWVPDAIITAGTCLQSPASVSLLPTEFGVKLGSQIYIKHITDSGLAARSQGLQEGDLILKVSLAFLICGVTEAGAGSGTNQSARFPEPGPDCHFLPVLMGMVRHRALLSPASAFPLPNVGLVSSTLTDLAVSSTLTAFRAGCSADSWTLPKRLTAQKADLEKPPASRTGFFLSSAPESLFLVIPRTGVPKHFQITPWSHLFLVTLRNCLFLAVGTDTRNVTGGALETHNP